MSVMALIGRSLERFKKKKIMFALTCARPWASVVFLAPERPVVKEILPF